MSFVFKVKKIIKINKQFKLQAIIGKNLDKLDDLHKKPCRQNSKKPNQLKLLCIALHQSFLMAHDF